MRIIQPARPTSLIDLLREVGEIGPRSTALGDTKEDILSNIAKMQHPPTETEWAQIQRRARAVMAEG